MLEVDGDRDAVARAAGVFVGIALGRLEDRLVGRPQDEVGIAVTVEVAAGADGDLEVSRLTGGEAQVAHDRRRSGQGGVVDGRHAGRIFLRAGIADAARETAAIDRIVFAGHGVADAEARPILDRQVGVQNARQLDDHEDDHQHDRQDQGELDDALTSEAPAGWCWRGSSRGFHRRFPSHCVSRVKIREAIASKTRNSPAPVGAK
jgi:hypothetical protein